MGSRFGWKNAANNVIVTFLKIFLVTTTGSGSLEAIPYGKGFLARPAGLKIVEKVKFVPILCLIVFTEMTGHAMLR